MHGKATLILTDKDTGRVVERREEQNMVTNALNSIFSLPPTLAYPSGSRHIFNGYLPMYNHLLKGLVLFGETLPENVYGYMPDGKYSILATAGDAYSGADAMRGSFNENQSCEIENGYRFVWDFAPEKAVGTIKCLALSHRYTGNRGNPALSGASSYYMIRPSDVSNSVNVNSFVTLLNNTSGRFFLQKGKNTFYSYSGGSTYIIIRKYRISDPLALKICDTLGPVLESETQIELGFNVNSSYSAVFYDPETERLFVSYLSYDTRNGASYWLMKYAIVNPITCEVISKVSDDWVDTEALYTSKNSSPSAVAYFGGKIYFPSPNCKISVCALSGAVEKTIDLGLYELYDIVTLDGKLAADCKLASGGRRCIYFLDEPKAQILQAESPYYIQLASSEITAPYCYAAPQSDSAVYIMFRTDYLATINNLASPLVKTDQHALQVRYEVTNE